MKVIFFEVDNVLNFPESDAVAPSGRKGIADSRVKQLKQLVTESGARLVLTGSWSKDWDFNDSACTKDGAYLNKKLERRGLHILDKTKAPDEESCEEWIRRHPNVTDSCILKDFDEVKWVEW